MKATDTGRAAEFVPPLRGNITGLILAGGLGRRMGGVDKGLVQLKGRAMVEHVATRLQPQVSAILINANRNADQYAAFGFPVIGDTLDGFLGPLAGVASGMAAASSQYIVTAPCDSPLIPLDLVDRLAGALAGEQADIAVAHDGERTHPVFLLLRRDLLPDLAGYLGAGGRKIDAWFEHLRVANAFFHDEPEAFINVNCAADCAALEAQLSEIEA
jgi:molybdopterin-guanine dinucleotide biosynthesis protein A